MNETQNENHLAFGHLYSRLKKDIINTINQFLSKKSSLISL